MGAQMVREVASKTSDIAGYGTTTATVLAEGIYSEGLKYVTSAANPIAIQRGINKSVKAAVEHLDKIAKQVKDNDNTTIVKRVLECPTRELARNAGVKGSVIVEEVKRRSGNEGYNVTTGQYEDLVKAGVVDPKKVSRSALQNSASIAGLLLTTECLVTEAKEKEKEKAKTPPGGGGEDRDY